MLSATEIDSILEYALPAQVWEMYRSRSIAEAVVRYLDLLLRWNQRIQLTSVRTPEELVRRHVAESLCCAAVLEECVSTLDLGSGAGFPGVPVQLMWPEMRVMLVESHGRKAAFLREVVRELGCGTEVFAGRAQALPERSSDCVCLRAVDPIGQALEAATVLARERVCVLGSPALGEVYGAGLRGWRLERVGDCGQSKSSLYQYVRSG